MLNLSTIKVTKRLQDGTYNATLVSYQPQETALQLTFDIDGAIITDSFDVEALDKDQVAWSPLERVLTNLGTYGYQPQADLMLDALIQSKVHIKVAVRNSAWVKVIDYNAPTPQAAATAPASTPERKARA